MEKCRDAHAMLSGHINVSLEGCVSSVLRFFFFPSSFPSVFSNLRLFFNFSPFLHSLAEEKEKRIPHELLNCEAEKPQKLVIYNRAFWLWRG